MSKSQDTRSQLCGNCKHFVAGGLCELVKGQIKAKDTCDLHAYGNPQPIDTEVDPKYNKLEVNYKPGFMVETTSGDIAQKAIQMEHDLLSRGVPENEVHRAVVDYFSSPEPPQALAWPGPVTGLDLAGRINSVIVPDTGVPLTDFTGLPENVEPYPTPNVSPYGIGSYPNSPTPDPNSIGSTSHMYSFKNNPAEPSAVWNGLASDVNSHPSMHNEYGFNVAKAIPEWRYNIEDSQMYPLKIPDIIIPPSGTNPLAEVAKKDPKKDFKKRLAKWALLLGGVLGIKTIIDNYMDSKQDKPLEVYAKYTATLDDKTCPDCRNSDGKIFNLLETHNRPVVPSENLGYTTRHPNCRCIWEIKENYTGKQSSISKKEESEIHKIESDITKAANNGELHKIKKDGSLEKKTTSKNPLTELCSCMNVTLPQLTLNLPKKSLSRKILQEAVSNLKDEFTWLTEEYISKAKELAADSGGQLYLIRAAAESITDHRGEGEEYRRKLSADELNSMTRTAIGKKMDINHQPEFETDATILDAEFDKNRKEIQMLVIERDPQINNAINDRKITAVSINGGMPRNENIEPCENGCTDESCELCVVPQGVVLGELDDIAMTWVVSDPRGLYWNGNFVPSAEPGIKITKIETL